MQPPETKLDMKMQQEYDKTFGQVFKMAYGIEETIDKQATIFNEGTRGQREAALLQMKAAKTALDVVYKILQKKIK